MDGYISFQSSLINFSHIGWTKNKSCSLWKDFAKVLFNYTFNAISDVSEVLLMQSKEVRPNKTITVETKTVHIWRRLFKSISKKDLCFCVLLLESCYHLNYKIILKPCTLNIAQHWSFILHRRLSKKFQNHSSGCMA